MTDAVEFPDEAFVCYECKAGNCTYCVGVPCMCDCPDPNRIDERMSAEAAIEEIEL